MANLDFDLIGTGDNWNILTLRGVFSEFATDRVSGGYLERLGQIESALNPNAYNRSGAAGLFQFMPGTVSDLGGFDPFNPREATRAVVAFTSRNFQGLQQLLGRAPSDAELYLAHQQGLGGARTLLSADPNENAVDALARAYGGDRGAAAAAITQNVGGTVNDTVGTFIGKVMGYFTGDADADYLGAGNMSIMPGVPARSAGTTEIELSPELAAQATAAATNIATGISGFFERGIIIVLGFIFVAIGLSMFRPQVMKIVRA